MIKLTGYSMEEINRRGWYQTLYPDPEVQDRARARMERMRLGEDLRRGSTVTLLFEAPLADGARSPSVEVVGSVTWARPEGLSYQTACTSPRA